MNAKDISTKKFDRGFNGYKLDDVDSFLIEVSAEFSQLQKDNRDLEKKLEVLADKVREYRNDEEALKEAMLSAQKTGQASIADAKTKAKKIVDDAQDKADTTMADARANSEKLKKEAEETLKNANDEAKRIHDEATKKHERMEEEYKSRLDINKEVLLKTKNEVTRFRQKILEDFSRVTGVIQALPETCENEFITKTLSEYQKQRNVTLKKPAVLKPEENEKKRNAEKSGKASPSNVNLGNNKDNKEEALKNNGGSDALYDEFEAQMLDGNKSTSFELNVSNNLLSELTTEIQFDAVFEEDANSNSNVELNKKDLDNPLFKKNQPNVKERDFLDFGNNKKALNKK